jgi:hypothetical protein
MIINHIRRCWLPSFCKCKPPPNYLCALTCYALAARQTGVPRRPARTTPSTDTSSSSCTLSPSSHVRHSFPHMNHFFFDPSPADRLFSRSFCGINNIHDHPNVRWRVRCPESRNTAERLLKLVVVVLETRRCDWYLLQLTHGLFFFPRLGSP